MNNKIGYNYTVSGIDGNGVQYITFLIEPEKLNSRDIIDRTRAIDITLDHKQNKSVVSMFTWVNGAPRYWNVLRTYKNEILGEAEIPAILSEFKIEIK